MVVAFKTKLIFTVSFVFAAFSSLAQEISIKNIELDGDHVFIHYTLTDSASHNQYLVTLHSSKDNFAFPLQKVRGDIGVQISPGIDKKIDWNVKEEYGGDFEGKISFEIRAKIYVPFLKLQNFSFKKLKRGVPYEITWNGGRLQSQLNFELYKGESHVATLSNIANRGHFTMVIPTHVKPGSGYQFRISDTKNKDEQIITRTFSISRKIPLLLKVVPVVMLGLAGYVVRPTDPHKDDIPGFPTIH